MSFILLGILNSQVSGAAAGSYELIESNILTSSASSVTFSSIPQDYKHLQIRMLARTDRAADLDIPVFYLNGDSVANYSYHYLRGNGSSVSSVGGANYFMFYQIATGSSSPANAFGIGVIDLLDYASTTKNKTIRVLGGKNGSASNIDSASGAWRNNNAITSIQIALDLVGTNFVSGSRFSLYGIRG